MRRTIITGAICLAAGYAVAAAGPDLAKDIGRYNKIRGMSDQGTLLTAVLQNLPAFAGMTLQAFKGKDKGRNGKRGSILSLIPDLSKDVARYKKMRAM